MLVVAVGLPTSNELDEDEVVENEIDEDEVEEDEVEEDEVDEDEMAADVYASPVAGITMMLANSLGADRSNVSSDGLAQSRTPEALTQHAQRLVERL